MKTFAQLIFVSIFLLILSPAKTNAQVISTYQLHSTGKKATKSVLAHAMPRAQKHALRVINPFAFDDDSDDDDDGIDIQIGYARPRLSKPVDFDFDAEISDYAKIRLALARMKAMEVFNNRQT
jgi:hypothetical protein